MIYGELILAGELRWGEKYLELWKQEAFFGRLDLRSPRSCVYVVISPWYKQTYVGMTERTLAERWLEHLKCVRSGDSKRSRNLYNWLGKVGVHSYVAVSVYFSSDRRELEAVERTLIRAWSPSLNSKGVKRRSRKRRRRGKKERRRDVERNTTENGKKKIEGGTCEKSTIIALRREGGERTVRVIDLLRSLTKAPREVGIRIWTYGGGSSADNWRVVRRTFGESRVCVGKHTRSLRKCKRFFEVKGWITLRDVTEAMPKALKLKQNLVSIFKDKRKAQRLYNKSQDELVEYYAAAKLFSEKRSRTRGRRIISDVFRRSFGMNVRGRIVVKVEFDDRIKKNEVVNLTRRGIGELPINNAIVKMEGLSARLSKEVADGFSDLSWSGRNVGKAEFTREEVDVCIRAYAIGDSGDAYVVRQLHEDLRGLVCCPLDRNPGDTLVMCPAVYAEGMKMTFTCNEGYVTRKEMEEDIIGLTHAAYKGGNFEQIALWKKDGKLGRAYTLPKHKDTAKYRPICPTFREPSNAACKKIARALNGMLFSIPESKHFNLKFVSELCGRLIGINQSMRRVCRNAQILSSSYDIKDMFSRLPHATIIRVVDWCIWWFESKGFQGVFVRQRGKGTSFSRQDSVDGYQFVSFEMIRNFVNFELEGCFTMAGKIVLQQVIGIPMGSRPVPR
ncbi:hypothetical protein CBR_g4789 [Chara braunii]|uniref:GIY-YIG domain-containing protein n=1 Tax=Chara braunii TaxID=69332 RepID=A0A388KIU5_CHABU|nr:hypothetical protein CBR_g4789 [Chara braunii]|eukprot:GBG69962.1 hypothetical protein CBR_g4789 [Chara braunii]